MWYTDGMDTHTHAQPTLPGFEPYRNVGRKRNRSATWQGPDKAPLPVLPNKVADKVADKVARKRKAKAVVVDVAPPAARKRARKTTLSPAAGRSLAKLQAGQ